MNRFLIISFSICFSTSPLAMDDWPNGGQLLYEQSDRAVAMAPYCEKNISDGNLSCTFINQYLNILDESEIETGFAENLNEIEQMIADGEDPEEELKGACQEFSESEYRESLLSRANTPYWKNHWNALVDTLVNACSKSPSITAKELFIYLGEMEVTRKAATCSIGLFVTQDMEFSPSQNNEYWVFTSQGELGECSHITTATLRKIDSWQWEYQQTRTYVGNEECKSQSSVLTYTPEHSKSFEVNCKAIGFSPLPW